MMRADEVGDTRQVVDHARNLATRQHARVESPFDEPGAQEHRRVRGQRITCVHFRLASRLIARPSRSIPRHEMPDIFWNANALRIARVIELTALAFSSSSTNSVRSTRCGTPSIRGSPRCRPLSARGSSASPTREQCSRVKEQFHRDTGRAVSERGDESAPVEESTGGNHRDVDRIDDLRQQECRRHGTGVAAAFATLDDDGVDAPRRDLLRVPARADRWRRRDARAPSAS